MRLKRRAGPVSRNAFRVLAAVVVAVGATAVGASGAAAKGAVTARVVAGPGITTPIEIEDRQVVLELATMTRLYQAAADRDTAERIEAAIGDLGPRYVIEYQLLTGPDETLPIRQQLYPYAGGGPVVRTPGGQPVEQVADRTPKRCRVCRTTNRAWDAADPEVIAILHRLEIPQPSTSLLLTMGAAAQLRSVGFAGWNTVQDEEHGLRIRIPRSWTSASTTMLPVQLDPVMPIAVGTGAVEPQAVGECGIVPQRALEAVGPDDAFVGVYLNRGMASWSATTDRPTTFAAQLPWNLGPLKCTTNTTAMMRTLSFEDHGTRLTLLVATGAEISDRTRAELIGVLDSIRTDDR